MAPRTRSVTGSPVKKAISTPSMPTELKHDPVKILIAPQDVSTDTRIISIRHPVSNATCRFLACPNSGLFELKKTNAPKNNDPRSILIAPKQSKAIPEPGAATSDPTPFSDGFVNEEAEMLVATPYDIAFVLISVLAPRQTTTKKALFQPLTDVLDSSESVDASLRYMMHNMHKGVKEAMLRICDTIDAGDEVMFRYSEEKVYKMMMQKAQQVATLGLPPTLEERFVTRVLEAPMLSVKREDSTLSIIVPQSPVPDDIRSQGESVDSRTTTVSSTTSAVFSETSTTTTTTTTVLSVPQDTIPTVIRRLQTIRTAYTFISASCLPPYVANRLSVTQSATSIVDFQLLDDYLKQLAILKAEALASRSISDFGRKRGLEDEEAAVERAEKKRKQEEEEKRKKANESRGVRDLKKVNVSGMKKMSDFFAKKPAIAKVKT